ncbi:hypothetical protein M1349_04985 [Patescibacteria group bacterium]|nr:hypothetical protein [Patescibacteria group bacterium]
MGARERFESPRSLNGKPVYACGFYDGELKGFPLVIVDFSSSDLPCDDVAPGVDKKHNVTKLPTEMCLTQRSHGLCPIGNKATIRELSDARRNV